MARIGMDVDQVEAAGRALKTQASALEGTLKSLDTLVRTLPGVWEGQDAQMFVHQWWPEHRAKLVAAISSVDGLGQSALNNASEQRQASGARGVVGTGNASTPSGQGSRDPESPPTGPKSVRVERIDEEHSFRSTSTSGDLIELQRRYAEGQEGTLSVQRIVLRDGTVSYKVFIPGTQDVLGLSDNPFSGEAALAAGLGGQTAVAAAVKRALIDAGAGPGSDVSLVGHSLGGLEAANLAADSKFSSYYHVDRVTVIGAWIRNDIPEGTDVLWVHNLNDPVGPLSAGGLALSQTNPLFEAPPERYIDAGYASAQADLASLAFKADRLFGHGDVVGALFPGAVGHDPNTYLGTMDEWYGPQVAAFDAAHDINGADIASAESFTYEAHEGDLPAPEHVPRPDLLAPFNLSGPEVL